MLLNNIYNVDCLCDSGLCKIDSGSVDLILCDLPYGKTARNPWDIPLDLSILWVEYKRIIKENGAIVLTAIQPFTSILVMSNLEMFRYSLVWDKPQSTGFLNAKKMPLRSHEDILVFYNKPPVYNPQKTNGHTRKISTAKHGRNSAETLNYGSYRRSDYDSTERYPRSIITCSKDTQKSKIHPTQKPLMLFEYLIKTYTNPNALVVDNCSGSGTTAIACHNTNRNFICFEKNVEFYQKSIIRYNSLFV